MRPKSALASLLLATALPLAPACTSPDEINDEVNDEINDQAAPAASPPPDGQRGTLPVKYPWGTVNEPYEIVEGLVIIDGDHAILRADQLGQRATARVGSRWANNQLRFSFDAGIAVADKDRVRAAAQSIEDETPLDFIEIANPCSYPSDSCATDYVLIRSWDENWGVSNKIGAGGGQQTITAPPGFSTGGYRHEFLHAVGQYHEQKRFDAPLYTQFRAECTQPGKESQFTPATDPAIDFGTYDFTSIMQYRSSSFRATDYLSAPCNGHQPLERINGSCPLATCVDNDGNGSREFINSSGVMSAGDVDSVWAMYGKPLAAHEAGDQFASAIAFGDFDGDGRQDVAVGAPGEDTVNNTVANAGAIMLYKGTEDGFQPWRLFTQSSYGALEEVGDRLGAALAAGDWNNDGIDDLAVGAPGESVGGGASDNEGAVYVFLGSATGLTYAHAVTETEVGATVEAGDLFGEALASGDFDGDGKSDLAIGAPGETHGDGLRAGHVFVMRGTGASAPALTQWSSVGQATLSTAPNVAADGVLPPPAPLGTDAANEEFGKTLAVGRIDEDSKDDLIVGAPCDSQLAACAGGAYLYRGSATGLRGWMRLAQSTAADASDRYGSSVAAADVDMDGDDDVLVGAPYDDVAGAADVGRVYWSRPQLHVITTIATINQPNSDYAAGDHFGSAIAFGNDGAFDVLAISARDEAWGAGQAAGAVFVMKASDTAGGPVYAETLRAAPASDELAEDSFGSTLAVITDGGKDLLLVGNPGEDAAAGVVQTFVASPHGSAFAQRQTLDQSLAGTRAN